MLRAVANCMIFRHGAGRETEKYRISVTEKRREKRDGKKHKVESRKKTRRKVVPRYLFEYERNGRLCAKSLNNEGRCPFYVRVTLTCSLCRYYIQMNRPVIVSFSFRLSTIVHICKVYSLLFSLVLLAEVVTRRDLYAFS